MMARTRLLLGGLAAAILGTASIASAQEKPAAITVDKEKKTVTIPCTIAPRKLPMYQEIYPIEVIATFAAPKGKKAHETVVNFDAKPSEVHKALEGLGLKPGKPAMGEGNVAAGPEVAVYLELPGADGKSQRIPIEKTLVDKQTGKALPKLQWHFTGSALTQPDPEKDDKVYGADLSGTLITVFPVTNETVLQANLKFEDQKLLKLETNKSVLPKEGSPAKLVIEVIGK